VAESPRGASFEVASVVWSGECCGPLACAAKDATGTQITIVASATHRSSFIRYLLKLTKSSRPPPVRVEPLTYLLKKRGGRDSGKSSQPRSLDVASERSQSLKTNICRYPYRLLISGEMQERCRFPYPKSTEVTRSTRVLRVPSDAIFAHDFPGGDGRTNLLATFQATRIFEPACN
jgi:hypothetical protein